MSTIKKSKQIICIRKDLNMRRGKQIAQGSHACLKAILDLMVKLSPVEDEITLNYSDKPYLKDWLEGKFTKICVSVNSEEELLEIYNKAKNKGLICSLITDAGLTEFGGVPTITCCAIGPGWDIEINDITGHLSLL
jgi:PTH2 family peptidyl-tRNA hydrolase